jgi:hypothetical protein
MPQTDAAAKHYVGAKSNMNSLANSVDWDYLGMSEEDKKCIKALVGSGGVRVSRKGRAVIREQGKSVQKLFHELENHEHYELSLLHLHNYGLSDKLNCDTMDRILDRLEKATTVQALYIQNFPDGMLDRQLEHLTKVLKLGHIWALNIGEASRVTKKAWVKFTKDLRDTNVTHMYASENTLLTKPMVLALRNAIRSNRAKHKRYREISNKDVINKVVKMWFCPFNSKKYKEQFGAQDKETQAVSEGACLITGKREVRGGGCSSKSPSLKRKKNTKTENPKQTKKQKKAVSTKHRKKQKKAASPKARAGPTSKPAEKPEEIKAVPSPGSMTTSSSHLASTPRACSKMEERVQSKKTTKARNSAKKPARTAETEFASIETTKSIRVARLSERHQMAYVMEQSERGDIVIQKGSLCGLRILLFSNSAGNWREARVVSYSDPTGKHTVKLGEAEFYDVDLKKLRVKYGNNYASFGDADLAFSF